MDDSRPIRRAAAFAIFFIFAIGTAARGSEERTRFRRYPLPDFV
jgi:hypothetical protein